MTKPTILVDAHVLDGKPQGSCAYIAGLYSELARRGALRLYVATSEEASLQRWFTHLDHVEWVQLKSRSKYGRLGTEFDRLARRIAPDHSHFQYITPLRKRGAWINTIHDLLFLDHPELFPAKYRWLNGWLFKLSARRSDLVLTVSEYSRQAITRHFGIPAERVHVTPNGVDGFFAQDLEPVPGLVPGHYFVCVSRFEPRKNQHRLVRAFQKSRQELNDRYGDLVRRGMLIAVDNEGRGPEEAAAQIVDTIIAQRDSRARQALGGLCR